MENRQGETAAVLFEAKPEIDIHEQSPIALAFVGDGVFEVLVRARLVERTRLVPNRLHAAAVKFVSAKGQYAALEYRASTALESLFGWLYLQNRGARIEELFDVIWNALAPGFALQAE